MFQQSDAHEVNAHDPSTAYTKKLLRRRDFLKRSAGVVGATSLSGVLAACTSSGFGGGGGGGGGTVTLSFGDMNWGNNSYAKVGQQLVNEFNDSHKGIRVTYRAIPWANWFQTLTTAVGSGTQPDIGSGGSFAGVQFAGSNDILSLDDVVDEIKKSGQAKDYIPNAFSPLMQYKGHYITLPFGTDIRVPLYRKDIFQQAGIDIPTTWDEWRQVAKKLTKNGKYGLLEAGSDNLTEHMLETLMINNGAGLFTPDKKLVLNNNPLNIEALRFFADLVEDGSFDPASSGYVSDDAIAAFSRGDGAMIMGAPGFAGQMDAKTLQNTGVIPPMASPHGTKGTLFWENNTFIYSSTKHPNEAKEFLLWWQANNKPLWTVGGNNPIPIRESYYNDPYFKAIPYLQQVRTQYLPIAKSANAQRAEAFPALNPLDGDGTLVTLGQNLLGKKDFMTSINTAQAGLQKVVDSTPG
jgi:multiple sugar transport system substrate-binding protein